MKFRQTIVYNVEELVRKMLLSKTIDILVSDSSKRQLLLLVHKYFVFCRWLNFRLGFLGNLLVFIACVLACYRRDVLSSGMIALIMTYAGNVSIFFFCN